MTGHSRLGVIGHRFFDDPDEASYAIYCFHRLLKAVRAKMPQTVAISALSPGADTIFAQAALSLGIPLETVIPSQDFSSDFEDPLDAERFRSIRGRATRETILRFENRSMNAYKRSMETIVFTSDTIIALWDGRKRGPAGGTWKAVDLAKALRKSLIHVDSKKRSIKLLRLRDGVYSVSKNLSVNQVVGRL